MAKIRAQVYSIVVFVLFICCNLSRGDRVHVLDGYHAQLDKAAAAFTHHIAAKERLERWRAQFSPHTAQPNTVQANAQRPRVPVPLFDFLRVRGAPRVIVWDRHSRRAAFKGEARTALTRLQRLAVALTRDGTEDAANPPEGARAAANTTLEAAAAILASLRERSVIMATVHRVLAHSRAWLGGPQRPLYLGDHKRERRARSFDPHVSGKFL